MGGKEPRIHNPAVIEAQKRAFEAKIAKNRRSGQEMLASGHIDGFTGFPAEKFRGEYEFKIEFDLATQRQIMERAVDPLIAISAKYGIEQVTPNNSDLSPHVTFEIARFTNVNPKDRETLMNELNGSTYLNIMSNVLRGLDFSFDAVVTSGRDTYICVEQFNQSMEPIYKARHIIERVMKRTVKENPDGSTSGLIPVNYQDILHSTIGKITKAPDDSSVLLSYAADIENEIGKSLKEDPINVVIDNVYHGSALAYHIDHASPQLKM